MTRVVAVGPLVGPLDHTPTFYVHAAGCRALKRPELAYADGHGFEVDATTRADVERDVTPGLVFEYAPCTNLDVLEDRDA